LATGWPALPGELDIFEPGAVTASTTPITKPITNPPIKPRIILPVDNSLLFDQDILLFKILI
jgi:hypothetical protein